MLTLLQAAVALRLKKLACNYRNARSTDLTIWEIGVLPN